MGGEGNMGQPAVPQRRVLHRGREFHFVAYPATPGNISRKQEPVPAGWFLMMAGRRRLVVPEVAGQPVSDLEGQLVAWLDAYAFA
jgi:hypothetical protein